MAQINSDDLVQRLLSQGEWWYALSLFSDKDLQIVLSSMGIEVTPESSRIDIVFAMSSRLTESGKYIDILRDYFNQHFLVPHSIPTHRSELWFNFNDCEAQVCERLIHSEYDSAIDKQVHKDFVLDALTHEQLRELYSVDGSTPPEEITREQLIAQVNGTKFLQKYEDFLLASDEYTSVKSDHAAIIEFLFGSAIIEEEEA